MVQTFFEYTIKALEIIGVAIILIGVIKMLIIFGACFIKRLHLSTLITEIRIELSNYLILSLEIFIGRDIIETLLDPSLNDIIILVVLVLLRTLLAFFLNYEMTHAPKPQLNKILKQKKQ